MKIFKNFLKKQLVPCFLHFTCTFRRTLIHLLGLFILLLNYQSVAWADMQNENIENIIVIYPSEKDVVATHFADGLTTFHGASTQIVHTAAEPAANSNIFFATFVNKNLDLAIRSEISGAARMVEVNPQTHLWNLQTYCLKSAECFVIDQNICQFLSPTVEKILFTPDADKEALIKDTLTQFKTFLATLTGQQFLNRADLSIAKLNQFTSRQPNRKKLIYKNILSKSTQLELPDLLKHKQNLVYAGLKCKK